jgi:hypothetical protein
MRRAAQNFSIARGEIVEGGSPLATLSRASVQVEGMIVMDHWGICQQPISNDPHLILAQLIPGSTRGKPDDTVEEKFKLLLCVTCWSTIDDQHSASGKYFRGLLKRSP